MNPRESGEVLTSVGHVGGPHDPADLLHALQVGGQTAVHAEDLLINDGSNGQTVEVVCKRLPELDVVPPLALVVKPLTMVGGGGDGDGDGDVDGRWDVRQCAVVIGSGDVSGDGGGGVTVVVVVVV